MYPSYRDDLPQKARSLRRDMTDQERRLWFCFLRSYPVRFSRQKPIGTYIADFYSKEASLVIELDGSQHYEEENMAYDQRRTEYLEGLGIEVLRFANCQVNEEFESVCEAIHQAVERRIGGRKERS